MVSFLAEIGSQIYHMYLKEFYDTPTDNEIHLNYLRLCTLIVPELFIIIKNLQITSSFILVPFDCFLMSS